MNAPLAVSFNDDRTRAAFRFFHPKGNILTAEIVAALTDALSAIAQNPHLKLITIDGGGADFSFGAAIAEHAPAEIDQVLPAMHELVYALLDAPAPTAAIVRGRCLGGGFELALACDFILAADDATFGLPEVALGVFAPVGSILLSERVGAARATRALLKGDAQSVDVWRDAGLIELTAPASSLANDVEHWFAAHFVPRSAATLRCASLAARAALTSRVRELLPALEQLYLQDLMHTHDAPEGVAAFLEKRAPRWLDR
jgi:cyclohexa-1,5-dienecarbonyl-CoA hydratase